MSEEKSVIAFVTELTRVVRNTDLDDPIKFAAFRQVAEEQIEAFAKQYQSNELRQLRETNIRITENFAALQVRLGEECAKSNSLTAEVEKLKGSLAKIRTVVDAQAKDDGLWFYTETVSEAYLQQELRKLHAIIESTLNPGERHELH